MRNSNVFHHPLTSMIYTQRRFGCRSSLLEPLAYTSSSQSCLITGSPYLQVTLSDQQRTRHPDLPFTPIPDDRVRTAYIEMTYDHIPG